MDPSSDLSPSRRRGVIAVVSREARHLVIRRSTSVVAPLKYCFPGGGIEAGETEPEALVRELDEELGVVAAKPVRCLWRSVTSRGTQLAWWQTTLPPDVRLVRNPDEVAEVHWMTVEQMLRLSHLLDSNRDFLRAMGH